MPAGRPPKEKSFANMLRIAINSADQAGKPKLRAVAEKLVELAINGDMQAIKEVADRLDGKVPQGIVGDDDHPPVGFSAAALAVLSTDELRIVTSILERLEARTASQRADSTEPC